MWCWFFFSFGREFVRRKQTNSGDGEQTQHTHAFNFCFSVHAVYVMFHVVFAQSLCGRCS